MKARAGLVVTVLIAALTGGPARAGVEVVATGGATVQPAGPRGGPPGKTFFNVEGKNNGDASVYASFGVLDFRPARPDAPVAKVKGLTLTLVQSLVRFSKDGAVKVALATDTATGLDRDASPLKFDVKTPGGVGEQLKTLLPLGAATFTKRRPARPTRSPSRTSRPRPRHSSATGSAEARPSGWSSSRPTTTWPPPTSAPATRRSRTGRSCSSTPRLELEQEFRSDTSRP